MDVAKMEMKKGQASAEMLAVMAVMMAVFLIGVFALSGVGSNMGQLEDYLSAYNTASALGAAINGVHLAGDGASATIQLNRGDANISVAGSGVYVFSGGSAYAWPLLTNSTIPANISAGKVTITNRNGLIIVANS